MRVFIPSNAYGIVEDYYTQRGIVALLRAHKNNPDAIQFIADILE